MRHRSVLIGVAATAALALSASAQQLPAGALAARAAAPANPAQSRPLPVDRAAAIRQAQAPVSRIGSLVNVGFVFANRAALDTVSIPVLLPVDPDIAAGMRLFPNGAFYTVSSSSTGMSFVLTGSGRAFPLPAAIVRGLPKADLKSRIPADGIVIEQTEAGIDASFTRFGAAYSIALECAKVRADARCKDDAYVRGVIGRLMVVVPGAPG